MKDPKTLSKLLRYSTTAAAVTGVSVANGQIYYEDFTPDINMQGNNSITRVDVDQDGVDDFEFLLIDSTFSGTIPWGKLQVTGIQPGNDVVGYVTSGYSYVSLLQQSSSVFNSAAFISAGIMAEVPEVPSHLLNSEIRVSDVYGRIIHRTHASDKTIRIDWSTRSRGLYVVSLLHSGQIHSRKVMIR